MTPAELLSRAQLRAATCRAHEVRRADRVLNDPFAAHLVTDTGETLFGAEADGAESFAFAVAAATIDDVLRRAVSDHHIHTVADIGAGLGTRPYRLELPSDLRWIEADRDPVLGFKMLRLAHAAPYCQVRRVSADLTDPAGRGAALREIGKDVLRGLVLTEAIACNFGREALDDLIGQVPPAFRCWIVDTTTPPHDAGAGWTGEARGADPPLSPLDILAAFERRRWRSTQFRPLKNEAVRLSVARAAAFAAVRPPGELEGVWFFQRAG